MTRRRRPTRRAGSGDAHEARLAILEHRFPENMQARCSWCGRIHCARDGQWMEVYVSSPGAGVASTHVFQCLTCEATASKGVGVGIMAIPRKSSHAPVRRAEEERPAPEPASTRAATPEPAPETHPDRATVPVSAGA